MADIEQLQQDYLARIADADLVALEDIRIAALGKQGAITGLLKTLGGMSPEERQEQGPRINGAREAVTAAIAAMTTKGSGHSVESSQRGVPSSV